MHRRASCCDFCGCLEIQEEYPTDAEGISWYACLECARFIESESWGRLIERSVSAWARVRPLPEDETAVLQTQIEQLVEKFRIVRLAPV